MGEPRMIAIADDLSGAADCAAACAGHGIRTAVVLHSRSGEADPWWPEGEILSIDANTRSLSPTQAATATEQVVRLCEARSALGSGSILFKKLDSTLRGNWAVELAAVVCTCGSLAAEAARPRVILAPALPAQGRTTVNGRQRVHGLLLERSAFWERQRSEAAIAAMLAEAGLSGREITLPCVRSGVNGLREAMAGGIHQADVLICDAETDEDLQRIVAAGMGLNERLVWAGSAGLASQLPQALGMAKRSPGTERMQLVAGPCLFVVGTLAAASCRQAAALAEEAETATFRWRSSQILRLQTQPDLLVENLRAGRDVLVWIDEREACAVHERERLSQSLAKSIGPCIPLIGGLVATGGETARALFEEVGIRQLRLLGEVEPGLPFSVAENWTRPLPLLTKAGGFGSEETLVRCREFLHKLERGSAPAGAGGAPVS